jgi:predicted ATPase/DNA-binding SARP family transcriptional activator/class 3 adenylate cyclase
MAHLSISLLGPFVVELDGEPATDLNWNKVRALLAYLAIEADRPHRRETLTGLLWPDWPERSARANLRNALSNLRKAIRDRAPSGDRGSAARHLIVTRETVQFDASGDSWVDTTAFDELTSGGEATIDELERAIALYRGPFLDGFSIDDSPRFEDWALGIRERLEQQFSAALHALAGHYERRGDYPGACDVARRRVALAPWQEQAHQDLMRLLARSGQRGAALAQFDACRQALREELDVEPGEGTVRLYERIRDGALGPAEPMSAPAGQAGISSTPPPAARAEGPTTEPEAAPISSVPVEGRLEGERRVVTALVAVLAERTAQAESLDVELQVEVMYHVLPILTNEIERYGGTVARYLDDGLVALFGASTAHEDDPERAVLAALAMAEAVQPYVDELLGREGIQLSLRAGVGTGEAIAASVGDHQQVWAEAVLDQALALTAPAGRAAGSSSVWVAEDTYRLVAPLFGWEGADKSGVIDGGAAAYRPLRHKGLAGKGRGIPGLVSPLVGRDAELQALQDTIDRLRSGIGGIVTVVGEAGIGKSRLVTEIRKHNLAKVSEPSQGSGLQWIEGRCTSYGINVAYGLWLDMLRRWLGMAPDARQTDVRDALRKHVHALCPDRVENVYPYLARMLALPIEEECGAKLRGLDAESLRYLTFRAVETTLARLTGARPLVVVCEDLHWADPTSLALLGELLPLTDQAPLLMVCVLRPERAHGCWQVVEAAARDHPHCHTDLRLGPLSAAQSVVLVANLLHVEDLPQGLRTRILERGAGNPYYVEEVLRSLIDGGVVAHDEVTGRWKATPNAGEIAIPDTLHGVLAARIDRLPEGARRVLQQASVIGRIYTYPVLAAIATGSSPRPVGEGREGGSSSPQFEGGGWDGGNLLAHLVTLERAELIRERARLPEREYAFKHVLTQEAAYDSLLRRERRTIHRRVAEALERLYPERVEEQLGLLARHWEQAGENERAVAYLQRAGEQAAAQFANDEAIGYLTRALELSAKDDLSIRYVLLLARERVHELQGARQAQHRDLEALSAIADASGEVRMWGEVALDRAGYAYLVEDYPAAVAILGEAIDAAQAIGATEGETWAHLLAGNVLRRQSKRQDAIAHLDRALALARANGLRHCEAMSLGILCVLLRDTQSAAAGIACAEQALHIYRELGHRRGEGDSLEQLGAGFLMQGDYDQAEAHLHASLRTYREIGYRRGEAYALAWLAGMHGDVGEYGQARDHGEQALDTAQAVDELVCERLALYFLGRTALAVGDHGKARMYLEGLHRLDGDPAFVLAMLALVAHVIGDDSAARDYLREAAQADTGSVAVHISDMERQVALGHVLLDLGHLEKAADAYERALALQRKRTLHHLTAEPLAGMARIAMADGEEPKALAYVNEVLGHMEAHPALEGTMEPLLIYLTCYQVLHACDDPRASQVLEAGYRLLQERAAKMDEDMRRSYLENVPYHREIVLAWQAAAD